MAQSRTYNITVYPVFITSVGYLSEPLGPKARFTVEAASFNAVDDAVDAVLPTLDLPEQEDFARDENGEQGLLVYVSPLRGQRKPAGFDRRYHSGRMVRRAALTKVAAA